MTQLIDQRLNGKNRSAVNRQRFIRRFKSQIRKAAAEAISERGITDTDRGETVHIPTRDVSEPVFRHGRGGSRETVHPGNHDFVAGDQLPRPPDGAGGGGSQASNEGEGEDDFTFELSREEFLELFFEDLELPNLIKTQLRTTTEFRTVRAGHTPVGVPTNINVVRSLRGAVARRMALRAPSKGRLHAAREELEALAQAEPPDNKRVRELEDEIRRLESRIAAVPFIDTFDLRYNNHLKQPKPATQAVMFCLMDVSGSMDEPRKDIAKRFFTLLYLFLQRNYERTQLVFIRHHTTAREVDEQEFFHARETGGTVVSSALELMHKIIRDRFPANDWNIYGAQASDGDNWGSDSDNCRDLLLDAILPRTQYYAYVEIAAHRHQTLWEAYQQVASRSDHFAMQDIEGPADIYPVFRKLMGRREA